MQTTALQKLPRLQKPQIGTPCRFDLQLTDDLILSVYEDAIKSGNSYAQKALVCGQLLREKKHVLGHGHWDKWLDKNFKDAAGRTVRKWMAAAERTVNALNLGDIIDVQVELISSVLTLPEAELSDKGREARQLFLDFTADKTIADCLRDVVDGSSPDHRISRAVNGKSKGGTRGEDRKDFPLFALVKFDNLNSHLSHWKKLNATQQTEFKTVIRAAILGEPVKLAGRQKQMVNFAAWPEEFATVALEALKERLKGKVAR